MQATVLATSVKSSADASDLHYLRRRARRNSDIGRNSIIVETDDSLSPFVRWLSDTLDSPIPAAHEESSSSSPNRVRRLERRYSSRGSLSRKSSQEILSGLAVFLGESRRFTSEHINYSYIQFMEQRGCKVTALRHRVDSETEQAECFRVAVKDGDTFLDTLSSVYHLSTERFQKLSISWIREKRHLVWTLMTDPESSLLASLISCIVLAFIALSSTAFCVESVGDLEDDQRIFIIEVTCISVFTVEYVAKILSCPHMRLMLSPMNVVDLASILPFYFEIGMSSTGLKNMSVLRVVRLVRILRIMKFGGRIQKLRLVMKAVYESSDMFSMMIVLLGIAVVLFATIMHYVERGSWNNLVNAYTNNYELVESPFGSIPKSMWWCIVTLMTVGYGDLSPRTTIGKVVATVAMISSVIILALPISVIGTNFQQIWADYKENIKSNPNNSNSNSKHSRANTAILDSLADSIRQYEGDLDAMTTLVAKFGATIEKRVGELRLQLRTARQMKQLIGSVDKNSLPSIESPSQSRTSSRTGSRTGSLTISPVDSPKDADTKIIEGLKESLSWQHNGEIDLSIEELEMSGDLLRYFTLVSEKVLDPQAIDNLQLALDTGNLCTSFCSHSFSSIHETAQACLEECRAIVEEQVLALDGEPSHSGSQSDESDTETT